MLNERYEALLCVCVCVFSRVCVSEKFCCAMLQLFVMCFFLSVFLFCSTLPESGRFERVQLMCMRDASTHTRSVVHWKQEFIDFQTSVPMFVYKHIGFTRRGASLGIQYLIRASPWSYVVCKPIYPKMFKRCAR